MKLPEWFFSHLKPSQLLILATAVQLVYLWHWTFLTKFFHGIPHKLPALIGQSAMSHASLLFEAIIGYSWILIGSGVVLLVATGLRTLISKGLREYEKVDPRVWTQSTRAGSDLLTYGSSAAYYANTVHWVLFGGALHVSSYVYIPIILFLLIWILAFLFPKRIGNS